MIESLVLAALFAALYAYQLHTQAQEREKWRLERSELLTRIQHPEIVPRADALQIEHEIPEDIGELALVGRKVN